VIDAGLTVSGGMEFSRVSGFSVQEDHRLAILAYGVGAEKAKTPRPEGGGCGRARRIGTRPT
jgi:hypothetical protein